YRYIYLLHYLPMKDIRKKTTQWEKDNIRMKKLKIRREKIRKQKEKINEEIRILDEYIEKMMDELGYYE
ncbi:MAG: hypothetical protein LBU27_09940, partial [Candidatus Peribacteria bacterium]|nr:hypothetical protein [Candidatus Peribacteria bacterium]